MCLTEQAARRRPGMSLVPSAGGDAGAAPSTASVEERYVRHVDSVASGAEHSVEYDMDDEDEAWLAKYNKQVGPCFVGLLMHGFASDRSVMSSEHHIDWLHVCLQRLLSSTRGPRLSEDAFEGVIDSLEKGLHHVLEQRTELWPNVVEASREAPDIETIFPVEEACSLAVSLCLIYDGQPPCTRQVCSLKSEHPPGTDG